jgi:hypothetical protein
MLPFGSLWLPVLLSTLATFLLSSICWMVLPHHRKDYKKLPDEEGVSAALRKQLPEPGQYLLPHCSHGSPEWKDPAFLEKLKQGPVGVLMLRPPGPPAMGKSLAQWFVYAFFTSFLVGYIARHALHAGDPCLDVFRLTGTIFMGIFVLAHVPESIWMGRPWRATITQMIDGLLYSLAGAALFAWLWPAAA